MSFIVSGLDPTPFRPWFGADDAELRAAGIYRRRVDARPGYPCRVTLTDAEIGETALLFHHVSHAVPTPYRSAYAIFVREGAERAASFVDEAPPVFAGRPIALRQFDRDGMLIGADLALKSDACARIEAAFARTEVAYIHAHNAAHGCFVARVDRKSR
jgi:hypothetical protein